MHESQLLLTLTASLAAALALGFVTQRLGLSPIVGYLLAGLLVGPYTPGFVADRDLAQEFAEIGIVLMMFGVGLHFHLKDLLAVKYVATIGALCQSAAATLLGAFAGHAFGWTWSTSLVFGMALSVASTVMLTRVLVDNRALQTRTGRIAVGWLLVEDLFTVAVLVLLPEVFSPSNGEISSLVSVMAITAAKLAVLVTVVSVIGGRVFPRILTRIAATQSRELFTLTVLVLALGTAIGSARGFGVSMALGAFLAGMIVGQSEFSFRAASEALPMRDAFSVLFFVSVGMLLDPRALMVSPALLWIALGIVLIGKPVVAFAIVVMLGYGSRIATGVAVALSQIGEFSLILVTVGGELKIFPDDATNIVIAVSVVSLTLNPLEYKAVGWIEKTLARSTRLWRLLNRVPESHDLPAQIPKEEALAVVVGYGPVGKTVSRLLRDGGIEPVIIEMNLETAHHANSDGRHVVYGDAGDAAILEAAGIRTAVALVLSASTTEPYSGIIRTARGMNPAMRVLARANYLRESVTMRNVGADAVFAGEGEVALAMTEYVLGMLGATAEQMDRERGRVRSEVFPGSR